MTQKTNQFNLTVLRQSEVQLKVNYFQKNLIYAFFLKTSLVIMEQLD